MIGQDTKAAAIENHRTPQRVLGGFEFPNDLSKTHSGIFLLEDEAKVVLDRTENHKNCPGGSARLIKDVIKFKPGRLEFLFSGRSR